MSPNNAASAIWLTWFAGWILMAFTSARTVEHQRPASRLAHSIFIWVGAALLFGWRSDAAALRVRPAREWLAWTGVVIIVAGLAHTVWARVHLGKLWSGSVTLKEGHLIVRTGPYGWTRHPIYTGLLLALLGTVVLRGTVAALLGCLLCVAGLVLKIRQEEALLLAHFTQGYRDYQAAVPALIPRPRPALPRQ